jgi:hypothetical protein
MKRFAGLIVLLVMFGLCSSSYGFLLVYKISTTVKGVDYETPTRIALKGYLIMDFNDEGIIQDANLLIYGKDTGGDKVYYQLNYSDTSAFLDIDVFSMGDYQFIDFWTPGEENPYYFEGFMMGKTKTKDIGDSYLWSISSSLKGSFIVWRYMLLDPAQDISGTSNISAKLDSKTTKTLNLGSKTQDYAVSYIIALLEGKDYSEGALP